MVSKRKNSTFNRDAFSMDKRSEQIDEKIHHATVKHHRASAFMWGIVLGFILNTVIAVILAYTYSEVSGSTITARIVENRLSNLDRELDAMEEMVSPIPGKAAKELNEQR